MRSRRRPTAGSVGPVRMRSGSGQRPAVRPTRPSRDSRGEHVVGATVEGLTLVTDDPEPVTRLVGSGGTVAAEMSRIALSMGSNGVALLRPDGSLIVTDSRLGDPIDVEKPGGGAWVSVGGPVVPATSPPVTTGADQYLVMLAEEPDRGPISAGELVIVDSAGQARPIHRFSRGSHLASWSRADDWVVITDGSSVTLISLDDGSITPLGTLVPDSHDVLTAG